MKFRLLKSCVTILMLLTLQACQQNMNAKTENTYCLLYSPITYSRNDTEETKKQIINQDAIFEKICNTN